MDRNKMSYWLIKTEPTSFSVEDLERAPNQITTWDGVRNYQARNMLRDEMKCGDQAFLYYSNCDEPGVVAVCLLPGSEIAFDRDIECERSFVFGLGAPNRKNRQRVDRFRQIDTDNALAHHDALEFPDGQVVLLTRLVAGQRAVVLQLPAAARPTVGVHRTVVVEPAYEALEGLS